MNEEMNKEQKFVLTLGDPLDGVWRTLLLGQLHQLALAVDAPGGYSARVYAHVNFLQRMSKKRKKKVTCIIIYDCNFSYI